MSLRCGQEAVLPGLSYASGLELGIGLPLLLWLASWYLNAQGAES